MANGDQVGKPGRRRFAQRRGDLARPVAATKIRLTAEPPRTPRTREDKPAAETRRRGGRREEKPRRKTVTARDDSSY